MRLMVVNSIATGGGVTTSFLSSLKMLRNEGHEAVAVVPQGVSYAKELETLATFIQTIPGLERGGRLHVWRQCLQLARVAARHSVDRIVVNNGRFVALLKRLQQRPVICVYHGGKIDRVVSADKVLTINDEQLEMLLQKGLSPINARVIDNVLPFGNLPKWQQRSFDRIVVIGTLRLLEPAKGVDTLVDALGHLSRMGFPFRARIGSDGSQKASLVERVHKVGISHQVEFVGWVREASDFYKSIDVYVLPSKSEEWGLGIVEAQAYGLPVIATDCAGPRRLIKDGDNGLLIPRGDPVAMAHAIARVASSPELAISLARNGYATAERYLMRNIQADYVGFLVGPISKLIK